MVQTDVAPRSRPLIMPIAATPITARRKIANYTRYLAQDFGRSASRKRINARRSRSSSISMPPPAAPASGRFLSRLLRLLLLPAAVHLLRPASGGVKAAARRHRRGRRTASIGLDEL